MNKPSKCPNFKPLDDLSDRELAEALALLHWLRNVPGPLFVSPHGYTFNVATNLADCGLCWFEYSDADMDSVQVHPRRGRWA